MNKIKIYTDGACSNNPGPGGWGVVFTGEEKLRVLAGYDVCTTNNRMELLAVVKAFQYVYRHSLNYEGVLELYSDSAYVVNAINNNWLTSWRFNDWKTSKGSPVKNADFWKMYIKYSTLLKRDTNVVIKIIKVKGHAGDTYNEYVDGIAKEQVSLARQYIATEEGGDI